jgi:hypothetical protein
MIPVPPGIVLIFRTTVRHPRTGKPMWCANGMPLAPRVRVA